ncbi:hypothetical protein U0070_010977, partial [Myodes glareolus]
VLEQARSHYSFLTALHPASCEGHKVGDQQSAMFGECCFQTGDVKLTMGTGTFLDINTGNSPQHSNGGK